MTNRDAIDILRKLEPPRTSKKHFDDFIQARDMAINSLSQPERIKGRWIDAVIPNDNGGLPVQICDQCNTFFPLAYTGGGHSFCPHCGADMREVTE